MININHKSKRMRKFLIALILSPFIGLAQYVDMWHFSVPSDETNIYEATEKEWFAKVMSNAAKNGIINGWVMAKRVGRDEKNIKYITWISFGDLESRKNAYNSIGNYFDQTSKQLFAPMLSEIGRSKWGSYQIGNSNLYFDDFVSASEDIKVKYTVHNLAMSPNPKNFSKQQKEIWLPFFKNLIKRKQTKQKNWGVARRINPRGQKHGWNVMTVDGFENLDDVFHTINSDIPGLSKLNLKPIADSSPNGWYEQIIWEIIIRVKSNGEIVQ